MSEQSDDRPRESITLVGGPHDGETRDPIAGLSRIQTSEIFYSEDELWHQLIVHDYRRDITKPGTFRYIGVCFQQVRQVWESFDVEWRRPPESN